MKYVVYEVWTTAHVIEAESIDAAYRQGEPKSSRKDLTLSNWHVVALDASGFARDEKAGGLNYRQES